MKLAIIAPTPLLRKYCRTRYQLVLAHMMLDKDYVEFYQHRQRAGDYIILDNSVMELGSSVTLEFLMQAINVFNPNEVVLPDVPYDDKATFDNAQQYAPKLKTHYPKLKLMAVPQGENLPCFMKDIYKYLQVPEVDVIGIPKHRTGMRLHILSEVAKDRPLSWEWHLLGTWGNGVEIGHASALFDWVRGADSKFPVRLGQLGIALDPYRGLLFDRAQLPSMSMNTEDDPFPIITNYNCKVMSMWAERAFDGKDDTTKGPIGKLYQLPAPH